MIIIVFLGLINYIYIYIYILQEYCHEALDNYYHHLKLFIDLAWSMLLTPSGEHHSHEADMLASQFSDNLLISLSLSLSVSGQISYLSRSHRELKKGGRNF